LEIFRKIFQNKIYGYKEPEKLSLVVFDPVGLEKFDPRYEKSKARERTKGRRPEKYAASGRICCVQRKEKERTKGRRPEKYAASGGALASPEVPEGPRTHINYYGLERTKK